MNRTEKQAWVENVHQSFAGAQILLVAHNKGLSVAEMSDLRSRVRKAGAGFKVTKNLLTKRALAGTSFEGLADLFKGPTTVTFAKEPVTAAKAISEFAKQNEKLVLLGGAFGTQRLDAAGIKELASLPSLDELRAKILALLNTPATRIAGVVQAPAGQLARVVGAYGAKDAA